jgi:hypothetical protein
MRKWRRKRTAFPGKKREQPAVQGSYWTAYNGVSEWLGYSRGKNEGNRLNSLWFGDGANLNRHAGRGQRGLS